MQFFSHDIDPETFYCKGCGQFLMKLQEEYAWTGKEPNPPCAKVTGISHLVRKANKS